MGSMATRAGALGLALTVLYGCGASRFAAEDAAKIHTIRLAGFEEPTFHLQTGSGALSTTWTWYRKDGVTFEDMLSDAGLKLGAEMKAAVAQTLRDGGYQIVDSSDADAVFEGKIGEAPPDFTPLYVQIGESFRPSYSFDARLKDTRTGNTVFHQFYEYRNNELSPLDGTVLIRPNSRYAFSLKEIATDPKGAADGLRAAIPKITGSLAVLLKKP
jgi:hypothetical protein